VTENNWIQEHTRLGASLHEKGNRPGFRNILLLKNEMKNKAPPPPKKKKKKKQRKVII